MKRAIPRDAANPPKPRRGKLRNRKKPNYKLLGYLLCVSAVVSCVSSYVLQSPKLIVRKIEIKGIRWANSEAVRQAAGTLLGKNIILARKSSVVEKIEAMAEVSSARVSRSFPDTIRIWVAERRPAAILAHNGKFYLLQADGLCFHACERPPSGIPMIKTWDCGRVKPGETPESAGLSSAMKIVQLARKIELDVAKISVDHVGDICLNMGSGLYVKLGQPDEIEKKILLLRDALVYKPSLARDAAYINLSCPRAPVWKPKSSVGSAS